MERKSMRLKPTCRSLVMGMAIATSATACARAPSTDQERNPAMSEATQTGRTVNGHTYTDAPVDVKLGPNTFRIPANYLDSQIAPWPGEGVTLVIEWPGMGPTAPGARRHPRTNDFRKEIHASVGYVDRVPMESLLARYASNEAITRDNSVERTDPRNRLDLRIAKPESNGLTPYSIDEEKMPAYLAAYKAHYGQDDPRNLAYEPDWYVARDDSGNITTFIKCDRTDFRGDGVRLEGNEVVSIENEVAAGCFHYVVDIENKLSFRLDYKRAFVRDWKRIEDAFKRILSQSKVGISQHRATEQ